MHTLLLRRANATAINAAGQSGVLSGTDPTHVNPSNPITLFCIQLFIIICFTQGLGWLFKYIRQPRVIAEVVGGIILGPTVMGRIPHFTEHIFPPASLTYLSLISTIGLVLFLFLVGLEVDLSIIKKDWKSAVSISTAGMIIPFGAGVGIAAAIYNEFIDEGNVEFGIFLLFVGVAAAITAFPVLCRILTETKLLETRVGQIVLSAGVGNDVVGWILLALTIALVNASSGVTAVYILLCAVGWTLFVLIPVKRAYAWLVRRSGSFEHAGPTPGVMVVTFLLIFISAFMTDIIGVHAIFGGFLAGLIIPHEHGFARKVTEKIDDLVTLLFLPIYFVLSGLKTNLGLLNDGKAWGYTFAIIFVAFFGKFIGCAGAAKLNRFDNRESLAIGTLMSCKGLVELIVLNVGLAAGILDTKVFSMFVFMAVVLTVITTPLTLWVYPVRFHQRVRFMSDGQQVEKRNGIGGDGIGYGQHLEHGGARANVHDIPGGVRTYTSRIMVVLQKMEHLAAIMFLTQLFEQPLSSSGNVPPIDSHAQAPPVLKLSTLTEERMEKDVDSESDAGHGSSIPAAASATCPSPPDTLTIQALRLVELTGRTSSVMQSIETDALVNTDDLLQLFKQYGYIRGFHVQPRASVAELDGFPQSVHEHAQRGDAQLVILPWTTPASGASGAVMDEQASLGIGAAHGIGGVGSSGGVNESAVAGGGVPNSPNPFDRIFGPDANASPFYSVFLRRVMAETTCDTAIFVDRGFHAGDDVAFSGTPSAMTYTGHHQRLFLPFFGGADDRLALGLVVQMCRQSNVCATIIRFDTSSRSEPATGNTIVTPAPAAIKSRRARTMSIDSKSGQFEKDVQDHQNAMMTSSTPNFSSLQYNTTDGVLQSKIADDLAWEHFTNDARFNSNEDVAALSRITFTTVGTSTQPLATAISYATVAVEQSRGASIRPLLVIAGRNRRGPSSQYGKEIAKLLTKSHLPPSVGAEIRKTVGDLTTAFVTSGTHAAAASFLVVQAAKQDARD
ncbi:hypothetical protein QFC19_007800 [Naganishia cerealis]|uniref:Uncharacterized protein n=1 Tax=Naganishia cerealis TaxID=610337 RepID=A0ACC2V898_9TREE|nr:hypothetical protein QFC19_007800 [Naganishia cerealis]